MDERSAQSFQSPSGEVKPIASFLRSLTEPPNRVESAADSLNIGERKVSLLLVRHRRARRYVLRLTSEGFVRVTIPRGGSAAAARAFALRQIDWIAKQLAKRANQPPIAAAWTLGHEFLYRGEKVAIVGVAEACAIRFGDQHLGLTAIEGNLRPIVESHLRWMANKELPSRTLELAKEQGLDVRRVSVRSQRTRWGSCSIRRTISLNWRLIQTPDWVRDYIIIHELMHLREMNHSARFWSAVESAFPRVTEAERWLKQNAALLR